ncbi:MAG: hypothetical protein ABFD49_03910 [Armatimonadota bacterium]|nr:hypothetical protein [bacterium]
MWIAVIAAWLLGSTTLYVYLISTAKEPQQPECFDCALSECSQCPHRQEVQETLRRAA